MILLKCFILSCYDEVLVLWLGLGTKTTWLELGKVCFFGLKKPVCCHKYCWNILEITCQYQYRDKIFAWSLY